MSEEIETPVPARPTRATIYAALADARGKFPEIIKNRVATIKSEKGQYSYKYADLSDVFAAIDPVLSENGLTVCQFPAGNELITVIGHKSGESIETTWPIKPMKSQDLQTAQAYQAAVQVAKRYALTAAIGVSTEETVEGDTRRKAFELNDKFETADGIRMPKGAKIAKGMTAQQMAEEAARAIIAQFHEAKTGEGVNGAWNRNEEFIDKFAEKFPALYEDVLDAFQLEIAAKQEAA